MQNLGYRSILTKFIYTRTNRRGNKFERRIQDISEHVEPAHTTFLQRGRERERERNKE